MKRWNPKLGFFFTLLIFAVMPQCAHAQYFGYTNFCQNGGQLVLTSGMSSSTKVQASYPQCVVTVYLTGTTTKASIFSNSTGTVLANPFTANTDGSFLFFSAPSTAYDVTIASGGLPAPHTFTAICPACSGFATVVQSVGLALPSSVFTVTNSPVTSTGTLTGSFNSQAANLVFASPDLASGVPSFRALTANDIPGGLSYVSSVGLTAPSIFTVSGSPVTGTGTLGFSLNSQSARNYFGVHSDSSGIPSFGLLTAADISGLTQFYQTVATGSTPVTQRNILNFDTSSFALTDTASPSQTTVTLAPSGVTAGAYTCPNVTFDSFGRSTSATSTTCSGTQITGTFTIPSGIAISGDTCAAPFVVTMSAPVPVGSTVALSPGQGYSGGSFAGIRYFVDTISGSTVEVFFCNDWTGVPGLPPGTFNLAVVSGGSGGGGGSPGGSPGSIQFNNSGSFGGLNGVGLVQANGSSAPTIITPTNVVISGGGLRSVNNLSDVGNVVTSRTNLGLGTMATQNANAVAVTGGTIDGTILGSVTPAAATVSSLTDTTLANGCAQIVSGLLTSTGIGCGSGGSGITQLTGDVLSGPGSGSQAASVVRINGGAVPSTVLLASNSSLQPVAATSTNVAAVGVLSNSTTGAAGSTFSLTCTSTCAFNALGVTGWAMALTSSTSAATLSNARSGVYYTFTWTQDATGGRTCTYPSGTVGANPCSLIASANTQQVFFYNGTNLIASGSAVIY